MWLTQIKLVFRLNYYLLVTLIAFIISLNVKCSFTLPAPTTPSTKSFPPPEISPGLEDVTLEVGTNFMLRCESEVPIQWFYFNEDSLSLNTFEKKYFTQNPQRPFGAELTLSSVDAKYVQYYYCMYIDIDDKSIDLSDMETFVDEGKASRIYVFVNDPETLIVPGDEFNFHSVEEQSYAIVPCRPTTKDITLTLTGPNSEVFHSNDPNIFFNPYTGFEIFFHGVINDGTYICTTKDGPEYTYHFTVTPKQLTNKSRNFSKNNNHVLVDTNQIISTIPTATTVTSPNPILPSSYVTTFDNITEVIIKHLKKVKRDYSTTIRSEKAGNFYQNLYSTESSARRSEPYIEYVKIIQEPENRHVIHGNNFNITCEIKRSPGTLLTIEWLHRGRSEIKKENRWHEANQNVESDSNLFRTTLSIYNAKKDMDTGEYKCIASDGKKNRHAITSIMVLGEDENYIELYEPLGTYKIMQKRGMKTKMVVHYKGHPKPEIEWLKPDQTKITSSDKSKFEIETDDTKSMLSIKNSQLPDSGNYTVRAYNDKLDKIVQFKVLIRSQPIVYLEPIHYSMVNESIKLECLVDAFPEPTISWSFVPCKIQPIWPNCNLLKSSELNLYAKTEPRLQNSVSYKSILKFVPPEPGKVICTARNLINKTMKETEVRVGDIPDSVYILNPGDNTKVAVGDQLTLTCAALAYNFTESIEWIFKNEILMDSKEYTISKERTPYSYKTNLNFKSIDHQNSGPYECHAFAIDNTLETKSTALRVHDPVGPRLSKDSIVDGAVINKKLGESADLRCDVIECIPIPTITWYKDGQPIVPDKNIGFENGNTTLRIKFLRPVDNEGVYKCVVSNRLSTIERSTEIKLSDIPVGIHTGWIAAIAILILVLLTFIIILCIRVYKDAQIRKQLKEIGIENFEEGCVGQINESMTLDEQAELLPYDKNRFEFPKEKIHLGKQLGQGAFGVVHKAFCEGILPDEKETVVAVKMVKKSADNEVIKALASELKIMVHLGQHLNVVNLLGAVTKNIFKREMMVIVEYCRYGNVQNVLLKNRKRFVNQINPETDLIDPNIVSNDKRFSSDYEYNSRRVSENDPRSGTRPGRPNSHGYIRQSELYYASEVDSAMTQQTVVDGEEILSNNSVQPIWRSNYKSDSETDALELTTSHLISWAFQVARGMDYLASRKVLHGDLAARNILLCEDNIVKICDFGLARSIYKNENYQKSEDARLPVKWLALESLGERIFSTRSDVWSFGIVLWEFFSLAKVPYPGIDANGGMLYEKLKDGYRMEKPPYANQELYDVMLECWRANPDSRPLFDELERRFGKMLEEEVTNHYIDLNEHYLRINEEYQKTNPTDWVALMGSPSELAPPVPRYVNEKIIPDIKIENPTEYLTMSPKSGKAIFSPTRPTSEDDYVKASSNEFDFGRPLSPTTSNNMDSPLMKNRNKDNIIPEEIPMLAKQSYSDSEPEQSPSPRDIIKKFNSFNNTNNSNNLHNNLSNSNKITPKTTIGEVQQHQHDQQKQTNLNEPSSLPSNNLPSSNKYISKDNYVNVKSKPNSSTEAFTNPSYLILQNDKRK